MKVLLAFPPQWTPISPHFAIPSLSGQLKRAGFEVFVSDLNIDFYDTVLRPSFILNSATLAIGAQDKILQEIAKYHSPDKNFSDYPLDIQNKMVRYSKVKEYITKAILGMVILNPSIARPMCMSMWFCITLFFAKAFSLICKNKKQHLIMLIGCFTAVILLLNIKIGGVISLVEYPWEPCSTSAGIC